MTRDILKKRFVNPCTTSVDHDFVGSFLGSQGACSPGPTHIIRMWLPTHHTDIPLGPTLDFLWPEKAFQCGELPWAGLRVASISAGHYLQSLDDVPVVPGSGQDRVSARCVAGRQPPVHGGFLHEVVGLEEEVVDLTVQVHGNGNGPALGCRGETGLVSPQFWWETPRDANSPQHPTGSRVHAYNVSMDTQFSYTSLSVRWGFPMWILRPAAVREVTGSEVIRFRQVQWASPMNGFLGAQIYPYILRIIETGNSVNCFSKNSPVLYFQPSTKCCFKPNIVQKTTSTMNKLFYLYRLLFCL